ncbi:MAG: methylated-DNA--[protein]-cysteine S-methyltransferase [Polyangiaceae bacterium]
MTLFVDRIPTPIGAFAILVEAGRIQAAGFVDGHARMARTLRARLADAVPVRDPDGLSSAIARYFAGEPHAIEDLPVHTGGTPFQRRVWGALRTIPSGETWSYGDLARSIGQPKAVRAVGAANGSNPVGVVVPCHRVIGHDGRLTGYGGGLHRKRWLIDHESRRAAE